MRCGLLSYSRVGRISTGCIAASVGKSKAWALSKLSFCLTVSAPGADASTTVIDLSRGVVTQTSLVAATQAMPSGIESKVTHAPFCSDAASTATRYFASRELLLMRT